MVAQNEESDADVSVLRCRESLRSLARELSRQADIERVRIGRGVHDELGQQLLALKLRVQELAEAMRGDRPEALVAEILERTDAALESSRNLAFSLIGPMSPEIDIDHELEQTMQRLTKLADLHGTFTSDRLDKPVTNDVALCVVRVVNELLLNVIKHAQATEVDLESRISGRSLEVVVSDDGVGFHPPSFETPEQAGVGLLIVSERLAEVGGEVRVTSVPGSGAQIAVTVPLAPDE